MSDINVSTLYIFVLQMQIFFIKNKKLAKKNYFDRIKELYCLNEKMSRYRSKFIWTKEKD